VITHVVFFEIFDSDANGFITKNDWIDVYSVLLLLKKKEDPLFDLSLQDLVDEIMSLDSEKRGGISKHQLQVYFERWPGRLDYGVFKYFFFDCIVNNPKNDPVQQQNDQKKKRRSWFFESVVAVSESVSPGQREFGETLK
jgi:hypothetical protein